MTGETHSKTIGYLLWIFGFTGSHRFYNGKPITGTIWFFTLGLLGIGWLIDLFLISSMDRQADFRFQTGPVWRRIMSDKTCNCARRRLAYNQGSRPHAVETRAAIGRAANTQEVIMPNVSEIMTTDVRVIQPHDTLRRAATLMKELDVGALPVCDGRRLQGMLTDRDITVYGVAQGLNPNDACVADVMTGNIVYCTGEQDVGQAMRLMGDKQVRRLPVVDSDKNLVGIVSLGDLAVRQEGHIDQTVRKVSLPDSV